MDYKVFFAFQMDVEDKFGKGFIHSAIEIAKQRLNGDGINLIVDFGFRGVPGTPLLINEMLKKSMDSDMVLVDLSLTSSKSWLNAKKYNLFGKEIRILDIVGDKKSPNPNVLLETGYAWSQKGHHRTLVVMNVAFGLPDELPVDLDGFRWGITYHLDTLNYSQKKSIRKELANNLYKAFKTAIGSEANYQREKWEPLLLHRNWNRNDFLNQFIPTESIKEKISQLRTALENQENPQRIIGPKNSGKTRLAFELYKEIDVSLPLDPNIEKILYYDLKFSDYKHIESKLLDLKSINQRKILILDNCPYNYHDKIYNEILFSTPVSLLTIDEYNEGNKGNIVIDDSFIEDTIQKIGYEKGKEKNTDFIIKESRGNLREAIALFDTIPVSEDFITDNYQDKWKQILGATLFESNALEILEELALFTHIGYTNEYQYQSDFIREQMSVPTSNEDYIKVIGLLIEKSIIKITGDFIILEAFIEEFATTRFERFSSETINEYLNNITKVKLSKPFGERLIELSKLESSNNFIEMLTGAKGLIRNYKFVDTDQGSKIIMSLCEIAPVNVINSLTHVFENKTKEELLKFHNGRRYIIWTLEKLCFRTETFIESAKILFKLAISENENIGNNATSQFSQLFQLILSGTPVNLNARLELLQTLLSEYKAEGFHVIYKACGRALMARGWSRMGGAEKQAGEELFDYKPTQVKEIDAYREGVIELLLDIDTEDSRKIIVNQFQQQFLEGNRTAILSAIKVILTKEGKINKDLHQQLILLTSRSVDIEERELEPIKELLKKYSDFSISEQLEIKVAEPPYSAYKSTTGEFINQSEINAREYANELYQEGDHAWLKYIGILLSKGEQRQTFAFGNELSKLNNKYIELINSVIEELSDVPFETQFNILIEGYISGIEDQDYIREVIDKYLSNPNINFHAIRLTRFLDITPTDLDKLKDTISENKKYVIALQYLNVGKLKDTELDNFFDWLKDIGENGWWVAIELCERYIRDNEDKVIPLRKLIESILIKEGILTMESFNSFSVFLYADIVNRLYKAEGLSDNLINFLTDEIILSTSSFDLSHESNLRDILDILLTNYWGKSWPIIGTNLLDPVFSGKYNLIRLLKLYKDYKPDKLLNWMDKSPEEAPQIVIQFVDFQSQKEDKSQWSPIVLEMLNRYGANENMLSYLSNSLHSWFASGSVVPLFRIRKTLVEQLIDHPIQQVKDFAQKEVNYFENDIKREQRNDKNFGLDY